MKPLEVLERVSTSNSELILCRRDRDYSIQLGRDELMSSRSHGSEDALARLALSEHEGKGAVKVLVGGLGMGFTLRAALDAVDDRPGSKVTVVEVFGAVLKWNHRHLGDLANRPLDDLRTHVLIEDVRDVIAQAPGAWDVILLDVDNGPSAFTLYSNDSIYGAKGLDRLHTALSAGGVLAVWSADPDSAFLRRISDVGFAARKETVSARPGGKGARHTIFLGRKR